MLPGNNAANGQFLMSEASDVIRASVVNCEIQGQVKIAVIESAIPTHAELMPAHKSGEGMRIEIFSQKLKILKLLVLPFEFALKSSQRYVC